MSEASQGSPSLPNGNSDPSSRSIIRERQRVSRACDFCKEKKIRCNGLQPCANCTGTPRICTYNAPYMRGRGKSRNFQRNSHVEIAIPDSAGPDTDTIPRETNDYIHVTRPVRDPNTYTDHGGTQPRTYDGGLSSRNSPELAASNGQGHVVGSASGLNFLLRLRRRLRPNNAEPINASIDTFGDAPMPAFDDLSFMLPSKGDADTLVVTYFDLASPTYRFLHRPTVEGWLETMYSDLSNSDLLSNGQRAVLLTVFAQGTKYVASVSSGTSANSGMRYFQAAEKLLARPGALADLTTGQALLSCCFYVLSCSRLNHCWSLFGTASRLVIALGLHRRTSSQRRDRQFPEDCIELECRKRFFWCAYNLDKYLSAIMGRPSVFHDEDLDQKKDSPAVVEDTDITSTKINFESHVSYCRMIGPDRHFKLGRILSRVLRQLYGIAPLTKDAKYELMSKLDEEVQEWRDNLPPFLNPEKVDSRVLTPLFQRQSNLLSMAYSHVVILIYRSCLFERGNSMSLSTKENSERCRSAALLIIDTVDKMVEANQLYVGSWFTHYHAFCAVIVLYTYTLRNRTLHPRSWLSTFRAAERCQSWISAIGGPQTLAFRFCLIMEEYRLEVLRQLQSHTPNPELLASENLLVQEMPLDSATLTTDAPNTWNSETGMYVGLENDTTSLSVDMSEFEQLYSLALEFT